MDYPITMTATMAHDAFEIAMRRCVMLYGYWPTLLALRYLLMTVR